MSRHPYVADVLGKFVRSAFLFPIKSIEAEHGDWMAVEDSPSCAHWSKKVASFQGCFSYRDAEARYQSMVTLRGAELSHRLVGSYVKQTWL